MFWVVLTLLIVGSLPFLLSWYQINQSRAAVVDQAQKNHLIISRATADRFEAYLDKYKDLALNLAMNPEIYLDPGSKDAADSMKAGLVSNQNIQLITLLLRNQNTTDQLVEDRMSQVIQLARKNESAEINVEQLLIEHSEEFGLQSINEKQHLVVVVPSARPNVDVLMLVAVDFSQWLNPQVLGQSASLSLVGIEGQMIEHEGDAFEVVPNEWLDLFNNGSVEGGANLLKNNDSNEFIAAFAKVNELPWYVVSRQSIAFAEQVTSDMSQTAWKIFFLVLIVMAALLAMAYFSWVKPIRRIVQAQSALVGDESSQTDWQGDEVLALEQSFDALTKHINDRNALGQIFVDRYQVINTIGKGGMGSVFLGWDPKLDRYVALKTLPIGRNVESRESMSQTLVQEAITAARISHRNVVSIYDLVSTKKMAFIAMEYIKGESLSSLLKRKKFLNLSLTLSIAVEVLKGLQTAHIMGFVHRDIKPANIMLDVNGDIKITDFGTATLVNGIGADNVTGTHGYMAPEIYQKGEVSSKSDLFAVGVVLAECLLGKNPFKGKKINQTKFNTLNKVVTFPPWLKTSDSGKLFEAIDLLLDKNPLNRPGSAAELTELILQTSPCTIKWSPEEAGVKIQINEGNYENEDTIVAHS